MARAMGGTPHPCWPPLEAVFPHAGDEPLQRLAAPTPPDAPSAAIASTSPERWFEEHVHLAGEAPVL
jgi:hypothetical protein